MADVEFDAVGGARKESQRWPFAVPEEVFDFQEAKNDDNDTDGGIEEKTGTVE